MARAFDNKGVLCEYVRYALSRGERVSGGMRAENGVFEHGQAYNSGEDGIGSDCVTSARRTDS